MKFNREILPISADTGLRDGRVRWDLKEGDRPNAAADGSLVEVGRRPALFGTCLPTRRDGCGRQDRREPGNGAGPVIDLLDRSSFSS
jgi:hypothetical protein